MNVAQKAEEASSAQASEQDSDDEEASYALLKSTTLLIADDESDLRELMRDQLLHLTPNILLAANGREALDFVKSRPVEAVITDISMPEMTGLQLLAKARNLGMHTPFVIVTGHADRANILEALRLDASDFLEKPYMAEQLENVASRALELGYWIKNMEIEVDQTYSSFGLPADETARLKHLRKVVESLKLSRHFGRKNQPF